MNQILSRSEEIKGRLSTMFNGQQTNPKGCGPIYIPHTAEQLHSIVADAVSLIEAFQSELEVVKRERDLYFRNLDTFKQELVRKGLLKSGS